MVVIAAPTDSMDQIIEENGTVPGSPTGKKSAEVFVTGFGVSAHHGSWRCIDSLCDSHSEILQTTRHLILLGNYLLSF
jgi:hypothetical protein